MTRPTIHLTGRNHTWTAPMSDMQRERAEAPLQPVEHPMVLRAPMPAWCAGVLAASPIAALLFWLGSRL